MNILVLHGPNLNLLGIREPDIYGHETLDDINQALTRQATASGAALTYLQSNHEGVLVDAIQQARLDDVDAIIINPAAYSHTSVAILDALKAFDGRVIEVHLSNIHQREAFRHHSWVSSRADGILVGLGSQGYRLALASLLGTV
ncbi:type II 3-dehydroquinate dehydratase [Larsenimonas rhizosphaerae]|uniref:type II 3-dehydroquinate dehydratase n=1 Tax=Larsenimonas rhizosphaerae TaxID=2944682 RepID=UPI0020346068|nr:type II 3-dehydroquinate dehydratase [Larsenimonas rhizosphaerae]MCM2131520.1 type II 3-dehydroquinate dehydratase [Larsenimonas rhizosphaerae]